jgi:hypothetical protein
MTEPTETPAPGPKHLLQGVVSAHAVRPSTIPHGGPTREGHSNGLRVHAIVFGAISLGVLVVLGVALLIITSGTM